MACSGGGGALLWGSHGQCPRGVEVGCHTHTLSVFFPHADLGTYCPHPSVEDASSSLSVLWQGEIAERFYTDLKVLGENSDSQRDLQGLGLTQKHEPSHLLLQMHH